MLNKRTIYLLSLTFLLIISTASLTGCLDQGEERREIQYPGSSEINLPGDVSEQLNTELLPNSTVTAYATEDSIEEVRNWFQDELDNRGWEQSFEELNASVWEKKGDYFAFMVIEEEKASDLLKINQTAIIQIEA